VSIPNVLAAGTRPPRCAPRWSPEEKIIARAAGCGSRCSRPSATSASTSPTTVRSSRRTRACSTRSTSLDHRARAGDPPRREGPHRGVQRAGRPRARPQGHDEPRPHRERRAAAGARRSLELVRATVCRGSSGWPSSRRSTHAGHRRPQHNVAAQATTLGKRFASAAEELLVAYERLDDLIARYPLRGIKGPVGTARTCSTCSTATRPAGRAGAARRRTSASSGCVQRRARSTRGPSTSTWSRAGAAGRRAVVARDHIRLMAGQRDW
jgi:hypothetical protein